MENTRVLENTSFTSCVEHLNIAFTVIFIQLICTNTNCFYKIIIAKLLALNVLSIALYTFSNFNNIYVLQNYLSCHALKIKVYTQIIFEQETH